MKIKQYDTGTVVFYDFTPDDVDALTSWELSDWQIFEALKNTIIVIYYRGEYLVKWRYSSDVSGYLGEDGSGIIDQYEDDPRAERSPRASKGSLDLWKITHTAPNTPTFTIGLDDPNKNKKNFINFNTRKPRKKLTREQLVARRVKQWEKMKLSQKTKKVLKMFNKEMKHLNKRTLKQLTEYRKSEAGKALKNIDVTRMLQDSALFLNKFKKHTKKGDARQGLTKSITGKKSDILAKISGLLEMFEI